MVRIAFFASLLFVAACSSDSAEPGGSCDENLGCDGDLVCNFQAASPICLDPSLDEDSDGLANGQDLCPATAGGSNHDEDGDKQGDSCDLCPIEAARASTKDTDGDGLAGICDPDDRSPGDKRVVFETFASDTALTGWMLDDPTHFSVSGDQLKVTVTAAKPGADAVYPLPVAPSSAVVFTAYRFDDTAPAGVDNASRDANVAIYDISPFGNSGRARCGSSSTSGADGTLRLLTNRGEVNERLSSAFVVGDVYRLLLQVEGGDARCVQSRDNTSVAAFNGVEGGQLSAISLLARSVAVSFDYVLVVSSPPGR
jgi:hypothetical protein